MVLIVVSASIKALVSAAKMSSPELGVEHEAARVHNASQRRDLYFEGERRRDS